MGFLEALKNPSLYAIDVVGNLGIAVGDMGTIVVSKDGGMTWQRQDLPTEWSLRWMRSVSLVPGTHGLIVGSTGLTIPVVDGAMQYPRP